jgi:hypothetical protein
MNLLIILFEEKTIRLVAIAMTKNHTTFTPTNSPQRGG